MSKVHVQRFDVSVSTLYKNDTEMLFVFVGREATGLPTFLPTDFREIYEMFTVDAFGIPENQMQKELKNIFDEHIEYHYNKTNFVVIFFDRYDPNIYPVIKELALILRANGFCSLGIPFSLSLQKPHNLYSEIPAEFIHAHYFF